MNFARPFSSTPLLLLVTACAGGSETSDTRGDGSGDGSGVTINVTLGQLSTGSSSGSGSGSDSAGDSGSMPSSAGGASDSDSGLKFDLGASPDMAEVEQEFCRKVDVILAVDNSGSMQEEIAALQGPVFNSLPQQLLAVGNGLDDFQLAVIDACPKPPYFHDTGKGGACNYSTGSNYMISESQNLKGEFECVMNLSAQGYMGIANSCEDSGDNKDDDEQPALSAAKAVSPPAVGAQNGGFLRDDAVLFVVAITDEDEEGLEGSPQEIAQRFIDAKSGDINDVVFLGIGGKSICNGPYGSALNATILGSVAQIFENAGRGLHWDLCAGDLPSAFAAGIALVDGACKDFIPG